MKKFMSLCLTLAMLLALPLCFTACSNPPDDFVKGDEAVIDNDTPFVYDESTVKTFYVQNKQLQYKEEITVESFCRSCDQDTPYSKFISYFGNKVVRRYTEDEQDTYYTVYSLPDNQIFYVFLYEKDGVLYFDPKHPVNIINSPCDIRDTTISRYVYEQDLPTAILGDKLPSYCYLEYYPPEEIERMNNLQWEFYARFCDRAGMTSDPLVSDYYCDLYEQGRHEEIDGVIRCMQSVSFDTEVGDPNDEGYTAHHGAYTYDIYVFNDGSGILFFTHFNTDIHPRFAVWQTEEITLSKAEVDTLKNLLDEWDFKNIPTWNPEEFSGFDGENTYVYTKGLGHDNLISMWQSTERYGIYHIREAIEEIVRNHVTVERGRIYHDSWLNH